MRHMCQLYILSTPSLALKINCLIHTVTDELSMTREKVRQGVRYRIYKLYILAVFRLQLKSDKYIGESLTGSYL
jgi:hypothetical protein